MKPRKGREEHLKRNSRQTIALLLILTIFLSVVFSGCLGSEKLSDAEKQYWEHIDAISNLAKEAGDIWDLAKKEENK